MAHRNELYPFATGDGANVETADLWLGDNARVTGFQSGIASSQKVNTALRQAAFTSAMIGQFTAQYGPADVVDDGNVNVYESNFVAALGAALSALIPAGLLYEGTDSGTQNTIIVTAVSPHLDVFPVGAFIAIHKMAQSNSGSMTCTVLDKTAPIHWPDGSNLASGQFPGNAECLLFYDGSAFQLMTFPGPSLITQLAGGEGIGVANNTINLAFPGLTEEDTLAGGDLFAFYQTVDEGGQPLGHHRKTTWANIVAKIIAQLPTPGTVTIPPSGPGYEVGNFITQTVFGTNNTLSQSPPGYGGYTPGMTVAGSTLQAGNVAQSGQGIIYQVPIHSPSAPITVGYGNPGSGDWSWQATLNGTWQLIGWDLLPGYTYYWGYCFAAYWKRIA